METWASARSADERIGVISQPANGHAGRLHELPQTSCACGRAEVARVEVRHARVTPLGLAARPAHQFDALKTLGRRELHDFFQAEVRQDGTDKTQLHGDAPYTLTQDCWRWLCKMASHSSTSRCPWAKVGNKGSAAKSPAAM